MSYPRTVAEEGIKIIRHHDKEYDIPCRIVQWGGVVDRINELGQYVFNEKKGIADEVCQFLWEKESRKTSGFAGAWPAMLATDDQTRGTRADGQGGSNPGYVHQAGAQFIDPPPQPDANAATYGFQPSGNTPAGNTYGTGPNGGPGFQFTDPAAQPDANSPAHGGYGHPTGPGTTGPTDGSAGRGGPSGAGGDPGGGGANAGGTDRPDVATGNRKSKCGTMSGNHRMLPIRDDKWSADDRFKSLEIKFPDGYPKVPKGLFGIAMAGTEEYEQKALFFPSDPRIYAVNYQGDPKMGTLVCDLNDKFEIDKNRTAPLQSGFRVLKKPLGQANALAVQLNSSGCGDTRGGFVYDVGQAGGKGQKTGDTGRPPVPTGPGSGVPSGTTTSGPAVVGYTFAQAGGPQAGGVPADGGGSNYVIAMLSVNDGGFIDVGSDDDTHQKGEDADGTKINSAHISTKALFRRSQPEDGPLRFEAVYQPGGDMDQVVNVHLGWSGSDWAWWTTSPHKPKIIDPEYPKIGPGPIRIRPRDPMDTIRPNIGSPGGGGPPPPKLPPPPPGGVPSVDWLPNIDALTASPGVISSPSTGAPVAPAATGPKGGNETPGRGEDPKAPKEPPTGGKPEGGSPTDTQVPKIPGTGTVGPGSKWTASDALNWAVSTMAINTLPTPAGTYQNFYGSDAAFANALQLSQSAGWGAAQASTGKGASNSPVSGAMSSYGAQGGQASAGGCGGPTMAGAAGDPWTYTQNPGSSKYATGTASGGWIIHPPESSPADQATYGMVPPGVTLSTTYFMVAPGAWFAAGTPQLATGGVTSGWAWGMDTATGDLLWKSAVDGTLSTGMRFIVSSQNYSWYSGTLFQGIFDHSNTADRTYTFPNYSGPIGMMLTGVGSPAGAVTAPESTMYWDTAGNALYVNNDSGTGWTAIAGGGGGAPTNATYIVVSLDATLTNERRLQGTANQITLTDGGANADLVLSTPQNIHTGASPTFAGMTLSGMTQGSVIFAGVGGVLTQDNANVFYDDANNRLGLGTNTPRRRADFLDAGGSAQLRLSYSDNVKYAEARVDSNGDLFLSNQGTTIQFSQALAGTMNYTVWNTDAGATSHARIQVVVGATTAGDPIIDWQVVGGTTWVAGIDNSDGDTFKISPAVDFSTANYLQLATTGSVVLGTGALTTTATDGFVYVSTVPGVPTGVPTTYTGYAPLQIDTADNRLYFYSGGQWRQASADLTDINLAITNLTNTVNSIVAGTFVVLGGTYKQLIAPNPNRVQMIDTGTFVILTGPQDIDIASSPTFAGLTVSSFTPGSIIFAGQGGTLTQDNANFFFDDANNRQGLGTATPRRRLDVLDASNPQVRLSYSDNSAYTDFQVNALGDLLIVNSNTSIPRVTYQRNVVTRTMFEVINDDNSTGGSHAVLNLQTGGGSGGDPFVAYTISGGANTWSAGVDNSDSDKYKVALGFGLGGGFDFFAIDSTGLAYFPAYTPNRVLYTIAGGGVFYSANLFFDGSSLGVGTVTPRRIVDILAAAAPQLRLTQADNTVYTDLKTTNLGNFYIYATGGTIRNTDATDRYRSDWSNTGAGGTIFNSFDNTGAAYTPFYIRGLPIILNDSGIGNVGINTTSPRRNLDVLLGTGSPQFRLTYTDNAVYCDHTVDSAGNVQISPTGTFWVLGKSTAATDITLRVNHTDNTSGASNARFQMLSGGTSGGDPYGIFTVSGSTSWSIGLDNDDGDKFKISRSTALGTSDCLTVDTNLVAVISTGDIFGFSVGEVGASAKQILIGHYTASNYSVIQAIHQNVGFKPLLLNPLTGNVGVGATTSPDRQLDVFQNNGDPQLRLTYTDGTIYSDFQTTSSGDVVVTPTGALFEVNSSSNIYIRAHKSAAGTCGFRSLNSTNEWFEGLNYSGSIGGGAFEVFDITNSHLRLAISVTGSVILNDAALSTSATDGFLYIATCAGAPSGVPTAYTGRVAMVYDTTNNKLYLYNGAWKSVTLT